MPSSNSQRRAGEAPGTRRRKRKKSRRPDWLQRSLQVAMIVVFSLFIWVLRLTCRVRIVSGKEHADAAVARGAVVPCGWHAQLLPIGLGLLTLRSRGLRIGFLISPSREGEFIARVATHHGTHALRGSSSRTGREALTAMSEGLKAGISPTIFADGPRGPARACKPGAVILAQRTGVPIMPVACRMDRYWQIKSWDGTQIPKPFARVSVAVGALWDVACEEQEISELAGQLGECIDDLSTRIQKRS